MNDDLMKLCWAALSIGVVHTLLGPDHYVPFVAMARIGRWSLRRTLAVTLACGIGHVGSSVVLGLVGVAAGMALFRLEDIESARAAVAGWMLLGFGLAYFIWGVRRAVRDRPHTHLHVHDDGTIHTHRHTHADAHLHVHAPVPGDRAAPFETPRPSGHEEPRPSGRHGPFDAASRATVQSPVGTQSPDDPSPPAGRMTPWVLFTIFLFGPCEPLIPFLMYPAAQGSMAGLFIVTTVFAAATLSVMTLMVAAMYWGAGFVRLGALHRYGHALAGLVVLSCGVAIKSGL